MRNRLRLLGLVVGVLALVAAAGFLLLAPFAQVPQRAELLNTALLFGAGGALVLALRFLLLVLPDWLGERRSPSRRMRREQDMRRGRAHRPRPSSSPAPSATPRDGGVLVLMLVVVGLVAALLLQSHALARTRAAAERARTERTALRHAAVDALRAALQQLADDEDLAVDGTNEVWSAPLFVETPLGIATTVRVRDEQARFDLNNLAAVAEPGMRSGEDVVMDLLTLCGDFSPATRTAALRDFVDADNAGSREAGFYRRLAQPLHCPDRVLYGWRELVWVDGWGEEALARRPRSGSLNGFDASLVDHAALIPVPRTRPLPININSASREALRAVVGLEQDRMVDMVLTLRAIRPIRQLDVFALTIGVEAFERIRPFLDVRSQYFRIEASAEQHGRRHALEALVFRQDDGQVRVLQWMEVDPS